MGSPYSRVLFSPWPLATAQWVATHTHWHTVYQTHEYPVSISPFKLTYCMFACEPHADQACVELSADGGGKKKKKLFSMPRKWAGVRMRHMSLFENNPLNLWIDYDLVGSWAQIYRLCHTLYRLLYSAGLSNVPLSLEWDRLVEGERGDYFGHFCYSHNNIASL